MTPQVQGFDVSENNGGRVSFGAAKKAGHEFVFIKINEGDYLDHKAGAFVQSARKAGLVVGGYNYLHPKQGRTGAQEFDIFYAQCKKLGLCKPGDFRPVLDVEETN